MLVDITDNPGNWEKWGDLVRSWVFNPASRPNTVAAMQAQMVTNGILGTVPGPGTRPVHFETYSSGTLMIPLPTAAEVTAAESNLSTIAAKPPGQRHYPLPSFYKIAFGLASEVDLGLPQLLAMERRRLGEYTIQECQ